MSKVVSLADHVYRKELDGVKDVFVRSLQTRGEVIFECEPEHVKVTRAWARKAAKGVGVKVSTQYVSQHKRLVVWVAA